ncbi:alkaline protease secretion ATP-binding protein AprD [Betaproteobacteria bacterium]|nr:alkaline protease secretion ATP-binding protein AprD [Betaproteobacteria bacterium]GHU00833.1 alkaline protease secretion ATP-binding protein AprD [Betaproteobacteria bacterium]GHU23333.1 alkaline protease secretion ATP-binding protein AprD [Betaproteobacteria bacterium]GHU30988.1 alkaline protease secretion ATP-binding protein AprD [Betaproteobacteria bacterium]
MGKRAARINRSELSRFLWSFRREFCHALWFTALINVLMITPTLYMLQIFDRVLVSYSEFTLYAVTLMLLFFLGAMSFSEWARSRLLVRLGVRLDMALNPRVFETAFAHCGRADKGEQSASQMFIHLTRLRQFLTGAGLFALLDAPWTPIYILVLCLLHPWLGILAVVFCLILGGVAYMSNRVMRGPLEAAACATQQEKHTLDSKLRHSAVVESMGMLGDLRTAWQRQHRVALVRGRRELDIQARMQSMTRFVRFMQQSLSLGAGAWLVIHGELSPGAMIAANALMGRATHPVDALMNAWKDIVATKKAFVELEAALEAHPPREADLTLDTRPGVSLQLANVSASVTGRAAPILQDIALEIHAGMILGVTGPSGSGKSTLARVVLGIWPQTQGEIRFDGKSIHDLDRGALGGCLGYLPQDVELFGGSIADNVARFGKLDAEQVIAACKQTGVHEMILRFPQGYDTQIGEGGSFLSGGQRQRIGLARAVYGQPRLVVLDEPNANLDEMGDRALLQTIKALKAQGTTVILISHRAQIMEIMDSILTLAQGRIVRLGQMAETAPRDVSRDTRRINPVLVENPT